MIQYLKLFSLNAFSEIPTPMFMSVFHVIMTTYGWFVLNYKKDYILSGFSDCKVLVMSLRKHVTFLWYIISVKLFHPLLFSCVVQL